MAYNGYLGPDENGKYPNISTAWWDQARIWLIVMLVGKNPCIINCIIHHRLVKGCEVAIDMAECYPIVINNVLSEEVGPAPVVMRKRTWK